MKQREISLKLIIYVSLVGFIILLGLWVSFGYYQQKYGKFGGTLDENWDFYLNGELYAEDAKLSDVAFGSIPRLSEIDVYTTLESELDGGNTIELLVYLCSVEAYLDDELIYSYGLEEVENNTMVGSGYHFIDLPDECSGKVLHIRLVMGEDDAFSSINVPKYAKSENAVRAFASFEMINLCIGVALIVFGFMIAAIGAGASILSKLYVRLIHIGCFSFLMGLWTFFANKIGQIFSVNLLWGTNMEYIALYFAPVPFSILFYEMRANDTTWRKLVLGIVSLILTAFSVTVTILHFTNTIRYPRVLSLFHMVGIICILAMFIAGYLSVKKKSNADSVTAMGVLILIIILAMDIGRFNLQKYVFPNWGLLNNSLIPIGTLLFVVVLTGSYIMYMYDLAMTKAEKDTLTKLAYHDVLTGLYNRTRYEEVLKEYEDNEDNFAIISFDLNGLKITNDSTGHDKGDELLVTFSQVLLKVFENNGFCYRTGGDEFVAIVDEKHLRHIPECLKNLTKEEKKASKNLGAELSASYGVAYRSELEDSNPFKLFAVADQRMYAMKAETKGMKYEFANGTADNGES